MGMGSMVVCGPEDGEGNASADADVSDDNDDSVDDLTPDASSWSLVPPSPSFARAPTIEDEGWVVSTPLVSPVKRHVAGRRL